MKWPCDNSSKTTNYYLSVTHHFSTCTDMIQYDKLQQKVVGKPCRISLNVRLVFAYHDIDTK